MKTKLTNMLSYIIILAVVCIIAAYIAGRCYDNGYNIGYVDGYIDAYNKAYEEHKASLDSLSAEYKEAINQYNEAKNRLIRSATYTMRNMNP